VIFPWVLRPRDLFAWLFYFQLASDIQAGGIVLIQMLERRRFEGHRLLPPDDEMRGEAGGRWRARLRMKVIAHERRRFR
ncbi:hypothetical protein, partial [Xanthobacter albus]|uniref:hypothetical protein n=1 Tax=Xanthobacter albus TaxID=3119929 RepID=UPI0037264482